MIHHKPTKEELEANIKKTQAEIDALSADADKDNPDDKDPDTDDVDDKKTEIVQDDKDKDTTDNDDVDDTDDDEGDDNKDKDKDVEEKKDKIEEKKEVKTENKDEKEKEAVDWKKRYSDSTRENQIRVNREKKLDEAHDQAEKLPEPTEEELKKEYPNWDDLDEFNKSLAKKTLYNERRFALITETRKQFKEADVWYDKVRTFITDPKTITDNPELDGQEEYFRNYASKPERMNIDFPTLINSFLYELSKTRKQNKGKMFETGQGGSKEVKKNTDGKLTIEESAKLRVADYRKYTQYLRAGKIASE